MGSGLKAPGNMIIKVKVSHVLFFACPCAPACIRHAFHSWTVLGFPPSHNILIAKSPGLKPAQLDPYWSIVQMMLLCFLGTGLSKFKLCKKKTV